MTAAPIRVLIVDDDPWARSGLEAQLSSASDIDVVGQCADGDEVAAALIAHHPDLVMCDIRMPKKDGLAVVQEHAGSGITFLMMTAYDEDGIVMRALEAGAVGFVMKGDDPLRLLDTVRSVAQGDAHLSPRAARQLVTWVQDDPHVALRREAEARVATLTEREREFAIAVVDGSTDSEIAARFFVSESTVKSTLNSVRMRWGLRNRTEMAVVVVRAGLA